MHFGFQDFALKSEELSGLGALQAILTDLRVLPLDVAFSLCIAKHVSAQFELLAVSTVDLSTKLETIFHVGLSIGEVDGLSGFGLTSADTLREYAKCETDVGQALLLLLGGLDVDLLVHI